MKKLMMAVAAVFAVVSMASAAKISWGAAQQVLDNNGNVLDGGTAYLVYLGDNGTLDASFDGTSWNLGDDQVVASAHISSAYEAGSSTSITGTFSSSNKVPGTIGSKYVIFATDKGADGTDLPTTGYYGVSGEYTQKKGGVIDTEVFMYLGVITADQPISGNPPPPVPEPTTYALVGLAAAALALRKRFSK